MKLFGPLLLAVALIGTACSEATPPASRGEKVSSPADSDQITAPGAPINPANVVAIRSNSNQTVFVRTGDELQITLGTMGPGQYASPPTVSSPAVGFLDASFVGPYVPAGPTQRFRFKAVATGKAIIVFEHTGGFSRTEDMSRSVEDTLEVH
jgi:hypothetical protein